MNWQKFSIILGVLVALAGLTGSAWAVGDSLGIRPALKAEVDNVMEIASANQRQLMIMRFDELNRKKQTVGLTPVEFQIWCELGYKLGYVSNCNA